MGSIRIKPLGAALSFALIMLLAACGDDDVSVTARDSGNAGTDAPIGTVDGGVDATITPDADAAAMTDTGNPDTNVQPDAADGGGCNFATYVLGLINNGTSDTTLPATDLGEACTDNQNQTEFSSLFP